MYSKSIRPLLFCAGAVTLLSLHLNAQDAAPTPPPAEEKPAATAAPVTDVPKPAVDAPAPAPAVPTTEAEVKPVVPAPQPPPSEGQRPAGEGAGGRTWGRISSS
ncbi:MAG: hypothetical protein NTV80_04670 [Verrucomicrobia bacterium]|nr:hypothetical protein [Verrucomicrobiota bacterium]